ncbi:hypothetical protein SERLA73DRAFT_27352, partial [Serpula lacrymans var. lacrymans S7.3]
QLRQYLATQLKIYGMRQAGCVWNKTLNDAMLSWGFTRLTCKYYIYTCTMPLGTCIATVYVDDFLTI